MATNKPIKGIIGACLTPFDDNDRVNYKALEKELDFLITDCDAITIAAVEAALGERAGHERGQRVTHQVAAGRSQ